MENEDYSVDELDEEDKSFLRSKTPAILPDNPSDKRWSASQIKTKMYEGYLILFEWLKKLTKQVNILASKMKADSDAEFSEIRQSIDNISQYMENGKAKFDEDGNRIKETYVKNTTTINNKELIGDINLDITDIGLDDLDSEELEALWLETN